MEQTKTHYENFRDLVLKEAENGNVVFMGIDGPMVAELKNIVEQPVDGLLYDLNREEIVVLQYIEDKKWVNDYAVALVIRELKRQIDELKNKIEEK